MSIKFQHFCLYITTLSSITSAGSWINGVWNDFTSATAQNVTVSARLYTRDITFSKLVFIAEGFDANDGTNSEFTLDSLYISLNAINNGSKTMFQDLVLDNNYTILLVDFDNNWSDLKKQGYALGTLMQNLWNLSPKEEPIKYVGLSMGGIIGSFACGLKQFYTLNPTYTKEPWEAPIYNGWNFKVNLCLTVDSPHSGAFIPSSICNFVHFYGEYDNNALQSLNAIISTAATQMLIEPFSKSDVSAWKTLYPKVLGAYKQTNSINLIGICNGSWAGKYQFTSNNNVKIIDWYNNKSGPGESWGDLWSEPEDYISKTIFWGRVKALGITLKEWTRTVQKKTDMFFENAPGGYANTYADLAGLLPGSPSSTYPSHCFVPTFSSAALDLNTHKATRNLKAFELSMGQPAEAFSPMHKLYHQDNENQLHVRGLMQAPYFVNAILLEIKEKTLMYQQLFTISGHIN